MKTKQNKTEMTRRRFIASSAVATFGFQVVPRRVFGANSRLAVAGIGSGGKGRADITGAAKAGADIVALCDVDESRADAMFKTHAKAKRFADFRVMLEKMGRSIDACTISTPDHTHAAATSMAMKMGKHCYTQKPLTHDVYEARHLTRLAGETGVTTQMGNQAHAGESIRRAVELVRAGIIGNVTEAHIWTNRPIWPQGMTERPVKADIPKGLDWDLWLGPAAERAYHPAYLPFNWRGYSAFGSGCIGDWICHVLDPSYWALDLGMPTAITADTKGYDPIKHKEFYPKGTKITFEFPAKGERGPVKVVWYDGDYSIPRPDELKVENRKVVGTGAVVIGNKGKIMHGSHGAGGCRIIPEAKMKEFGRPDQKIPRVRGGHQKDWLEAVRNNQPAGSPFEYGGALSEIGLLGMIAIQRTWGEDSAGRTGIRLEWDAKAMRFTNDEEANKLVNPPYRAGWKL